ncbi:MAG: hypothetical protein LQ346_006507 [Caloplaca aetnensis]|nr:MAG: hypothetical protein LQ346_006507 [Caloplaca aetnensis]
MRPLDQDHARRCIVLASSQVHSYIQHHGDGPIPGGRSSLTYDYGIVYFTIEPAVPPGQHRLRYSDTAKVLANFAAENTLDGFRERSAEVFVTDGGVVVATALLGLVNGSEKRRLGFALPNPYPMPGTAFSVDFEDSAPGPLLVKEAAVYCINFIRHDVVQQIAQSGNVRIATKVWHVADLVFGIVPVQEQTEPQFLYQDLLAVLSAFLTKMIREGYRARRARILVTDGGRYVGCAHIAPEIVGAAGNG